jgi:hypothetical protein
MGIATKCVSQIITHPSHSENLAPKKETAFHLSVRQFLAYAQNTLVPYRSRYAFAKIQHRFSKPNATHSLKENSHMKEIVTASSLAVLYSQKQPRIIIIILSPLCHATNA